MDKASAPGGQVNTPEPFVLQPSEEIRPIGHGRMGTRAYMESAAAGRHPGTVALLRYFTYAHLPENLRVVSGPFAQLAVKLVEALPDSAELTTALRKLLEAKDCAVRAQVDRFDVE
jgi:hypothetical protein